MTLRSLPRLVLLVVAAAACAGGRPSTARPGATATVADTTLQVFLLAGQSNMAGRGVVEAQDSVVHPRVLRLDPRMQWVAAVDPLHWDKPALVGVGPGRAFGLALARRDPSARIGLVPAAVGGSPISTWEPAAVDSATRTRPYDDAMARVAVARKAGREIRRAGR